MRLCEILKKAFSKPICDHCLGRIFAQLLSGMSNAERGRVARVFAAFMIDAGELSEFAHENFVELTFRSGKIQKRPKKKAKCYYCLGVFENIEKIAEKIAKKFEKIEFTTFLVGSRPSKEMIEREEEMWKEVGMEFCEPIKAELNREIGKAIKKLTGKEHDPKKPDVVILLEFEKDKPKIEVQINPLYIFGYYQKLVRGIPQCKWGTPRKYRTSVEQIIGKPLLEACKGKDTKFHGMGREDIDARCLAWRPFVIEIIEPKKRKIDLRKITRKINASGKVRVKCLRFADKETVRKVKSLQPDKTYRAIVIFERPVSREELKKLKQLIGKIRQKTPTRVLHRRSDLERIREVKEIKWKVLGPRKIELIVKCSAGLYVKELVSGDNGRTTPSVAEILGVNARVRELDVIKIEKVKI